MSEILLRDFGCDGDPKDPTARARGCPESEADDRSVVISDDAYRAVNLKEIDPVVYC
jgi:hypothetical protein